MTPLMAAINAGLESTAKHLIDDTRVDLDLRDNKGNTIVAYALSSHSKQMVNLVARHPRINLQVPVRQTSEEEGQRDCVTPLVWAANQGYESRVD